MAKICKEMQTYLLLQGALISSVAFWQDWKKSFLLMDTQKGNKQNFNVMYQTSLRLV